MGNPFRKKDGTINPVVVGIGVVVAVLLVSVIALGISLSVSANRALGLATEARAAYDGACKNLDDGNFDEAYASARSAVDSVSALSKELEGPQWSIAAALPVLGADVQMAREMSSIAGRLADEAALPVFNQWDSIAHVLAEGDSIGGAVRAGAFIMEKRSEFAETLAHAKQVVFECEERANGLPTAHIGQLNDAARELKDSLNAVGDMLRAFDQVVDALGSADSIEDALGSLDLGSLLEGVDLSGLFKG